MKHADYLGSLIDRLVFGEFDIFTEAINGNLN